MAYEHSFDDGPSEIDETMPAPLLMNCWKHHARIINRRIQTAVAAGDEAVRALPDRLVQIGAALMDLYLGDLTPVDVARETLAQLAGHQAVDPQPFREWLATTDGYATLELSDTSKWVLREAPLEDRHIHIHPARYSPLSVRVRANLLKSAIVTLAWAQHRQLDPVSLETVNEARTTLLELSPIKAVSPDEGLGELLRQLLAVRDRE